VALEAGDSLRPSTAAMAVAPSRARLRTITAHVASNEKEEERQARQAALQRRQMEAVVKIFVRSVDTSYSTPWQKLETESSSGSGFAISGRRVLTNAHVVNNCNSLRLQRPGRPGQWEGKVLCIARQCDLALVSVAEDSFWEGLPLLQFSDELPALDTSVTAIGYPVGGDNLAITRGVVSRVDLMDYTMLGLGDPPLVVIQIDAAINPGNSGGPVFDQDLAVCGVAFAGRSRSNSVGYVIPARCAVTVLVVWWCGFGWNGLNEKCVGAASSSCSWRPWWRAGNLQVCHRWVWAFNLPKTSR
jgi:S1-C subfamily serine protease